MKALSHWTEDLADCADDHLPDELFDRILALGERARPRLVDFATDPEYRGLAGRGEGRVTIHATDLLAELPLHDSTVAALVASIDADPSAVEVEDLVSCLARLGAGVLPRVIAALETTTSADVAWSLVDVVVNCRAPADAVVPALVHAIERFPGDVAVSAAALHDERLVPPLRAAFAKHHVGAGTSADDDERALSMAFALEELGARLTEEEVRKRDLAERRAERRHLRDAPPQDEDDAPDDDELPYLESVPLPNDPCPCGSGRKYKKCHEGDAGFLPPTP